MGIGDSDEWREAEAALQSREALTWGTGSVG